ncbi:MAG: hypothetical protein HN909_00505 [Phycisphaerales bacterium]|nr:hypothetical protein [Phycisphaerales bacterium]MBT7170229.1 hypothetical protein [Phycisphaerales bacterium]
MTVHQDEITIWNFLTSDAGAALLAEDWSGESLAAIGQLRKRCAPEQAAAVYSLWQARQKAAGKFPESFAHDAFLTDRMLQQASSWRMATWLGREFAAAGCDAVWDLCSSMGVDAIGLAGANVPTVGLDCDPVAVLCAKHNAAIAGAQQCEFRLGRVEESLGEIPAGAWVHIDPDRRASGKRSAALSDYSPSEDILRRVIDQTAGGAMKLSPALGFGALEEWGVNIEYVSEKRVCRQLVAWWGEAAASRPARCATLVAGEADSLTVTRVVCGEAGMSSVKPLGAYLYELDPAVIAADGVDDLAALGELWRIDARLDWLSGDNLFEHPALRTFSVLGECPARPRDLRAALRGLDAGEVAIKPRGIQVNTTRLQREFRGTGERRIAIFWGRFGRKERCILAERL